MIREAIQRYLRRHRLRQLNLKAVLFDMDGVLFDSMRYHAEAWKEVSDRYGLISDLVDFYLFEGRTGGSTIDELFQRTFGREATQQEKKTIYEEKATLFASLNTEEVMPGARGVVEQVRKAGLTTVLVTGSGQVSLLERLEHYFPDAFGKERMVTAFDVEHGKPHPEPYLMGLEKAGVSSGEALVVENAPLGVEAGVAAGIFTIAVNTGPLSDEVLLHAGADLLYPSMSLLEQDMNLILSLMKEEKSKS